MTVIEHPHGIDVDLSSPSAFQFGVPHATFDRDRELAPVRWVEVTPRARLPEGGFWSVTSHEFCREALKRADVFSAHKGSIRMEDPGPETLAFMQAMLIVMDPPDHTDRRMLINQSFLPRIIGQMTESITTITNDAIDRIAAQGEAEFVSAISADVTMTVIADMLGVDRADLAQFRKWSDTIVSQDDPEFAGGPADVIKAMKELNGYGARVMADRRANPRDDLLSAIATAEENGRQLEGPDLVMFWYLLLLAGNETTRNAASGAMVQFSENPDQWELLRENRDLLGSASEEILRHVSPVTYFRRTAKVDAELGGEHIKAGDKVILWLAAANRDPKVFDDPHRFDISRGVTEHLAFGHGTHFCLGAHLARLELRTIFDRLLDRVPDMRVSGEPERAQNNFISTIKRLPVTFTPT